MKTLLITISLFIAISSCAKKEEKDSTDTTSNSFFVAVGYKGNILTSNDGTTWISRDSGTTEDMGDIIYANNTYVAIANNGTILTSLDAKTWTSRTSGTNENLYGITY